MQVQADDCIVCMSLIGVSVCKSLVEASVCKSFGGGSVCKSLGGASVYKQPSALATRKQNTCKLVANNTCNALATQKQNTCKLVANNTCNVLATWKQNTCKLVANNTCNVLATRRQNMLAINLQYGGKLSEKHTRVSRIVGVSLCNCYFMGLYKDTTRMMEKMQCLRLCVNKSLLVHQITSLLHDEAD
eukprot:1160709-Pelagomonas_calceolata.AAC.12